MRIVFEQNKQKEFLQAVKQKSGLSWEKIAAEYNLSSRTFRDWQREKFLMKYEITKELSEKFSIPLPNPMKLKPEFWSTKKAGKKSALINYKKLGNPGTPEGRSRGGKNSAKLRSLYPEKYPNVIIRKEITKPKVCSELAEFIGIVLGDGNITNHQVTISLNTITDFPYARYIVKLAEKLFNISAGLRNHSDNCTSIIFSSTNLVDFLLEKGLQKGNKVKNNAKIPSWIFALPNFQKACLKGLIDTDGNVARKNYHAKTLSLQISFCNHARNLLNDARNIMINLGFHPSRITRNQIHLTRKEDVRKYVKLIGFGNEKHWLRLDKYLEVDKSYLEESHSG